MVDALIARLAAAGCVAPDEEAVQLLAGAPDDHTLAEWLRRRERGEPLAWIIGAVRFCDRTIRVDPGVYVPRPHSEVLARRAAMVLPPGGRAVDLCTGAGAIAAHLRAVVPRATVIGIDVDPRAVTCARRNGVVAVVGELDHAPLPTAAADVVTAVAPYVPTDAVRLLPADVRRHEPRHALDGGRDGLELVRGVVTSAAHLLRRGGWLLTEVGGEQDRAITADLEGSGFEHVAPWFDDDGDLRGITARLGR